MKITLLRVPDWPDRTGDLTAEDPGAGACRVYRHRPVARRSTLVDAIVERPERPARRAAATRRADACR